MATDPEILRLCSLKAENYIYLQDLLGLESNSLTAQPSLPVSATTIVTPLLLPAWHRFLTRFPDSQFSAFILRGIANGFRVRFVESGSCQSNTRNMRSAYEHNNVVQEYLDHEASLGTAEEVVAVPHLQVNPLGVIPKKG